MVSHGLRRSCLLLMGISISTILLMTLGRLLIVVENSLMYLFLVYKEELPTTPRRKFCYPMKERPANILVPGIFYLNQDGNSDMRNRFVRAWHHVDRRRHLGTKQCVALKDYTDWVQARAHTFQMPYLLEEPSLPIVPSLPLTTPVESSEEHLELMAKLRAERDALEFENKELKIHLKEKDEMLDI